MAKRSIFIQLKENERSYRREIILNAAIRLYDKHSFHDIGMRDIGKEAGISPASIYRYFSSRDDILAEILNHIKMIGLDRQWQRCKSESVSLEEIAAGIVDFFWERESILQIVGHFLWNYDVDEEAQKKFQTIQKTYLDEFDRMLTGMVYNVPELRLFSKSFIASILGLIATYRNDPQGATSSEAYANLHHLAHATAGIFRNGMSQLAYSSPENALSG